jgi:hypothetical protein
MFAGVIGTGARRLVDMPGGAVETVLGFVGLVLLLAGLALPEGGTSTAVHVVAIGFFVAAFVFLARDYKAGTTGSLVVDSRGAEGRSGEGEELRRVLGTGYSPNATLPTYDVLASNRKGQDNSGPRPAAHQDGCLSTPLGGLSLAS